MWQASSYIPNLVATIFSSLLACFVLYLFLKVSKPSVLIFFSMRIPIKEIKVKYCQTLFYLWQKGVISNLLIKLYSSRKTFCSFIQFYTQKLVNAASQSSLSMSFKVFNSSGEYKIDYLSKISISFFFFSRSYNFMSRILSNLPFAGFFTVKLLQLMMAIVALR